VVSVSLRPDDVQPELDLGVRRPPPQRPTSMSAQPQCLGRRPLETVGLSMAALRRWLILSLIRAKRSLRASG